jgi:hypothetical protein
MTSVETLLSEYVAEHRRGGAADPVEYLARAAPSDWGELAALIDGYLSRVPRTPLAERGGSDPRTEATIEALSRSIGGAAGVWPALLPRLRDRAGLKRRELVERLASALGVSGREPKVERYYHEMELGTLPASGVSDKVLEALAGLVGSTAAELRRAGSVLGADDGGPAAQAAVFARTASIEGATFSAPEIAASTGHAEWDEVDELFCGSE